MSRLKGLARRYREMATDVAWSGISDVFNLVGNLLSFLLLGNTLALATYGGYVGTYGVIAPLGAFTWSGLSLLILQRVIREHDDPQTVASRAYTLAITQGVVAVALATLLGSLLISNIRASTILVIATAELLFFPITQASATLIQATRGFAAAAKLRIFLPAVRLVSLLIPYSLGILTVRSLAFSWLIGFAIVAVISTLIALPSMGLRFGLGKPSREYIKGNVELSLPLTANTLQQNGDKAVMNGFGLEADAGLYGAAYRIISLSQLPIRTMNQALFQRFLPDNEGDTGQHVRRATRFSAVALGLSLVICVALFFMAPALTFLVGDKFSESVTIVRWLLVIVPLLAVSRAPLNGLLGLGQTQIRAGLILSSALLSLVLYLTLVPVMSWRGAAIGTVISDLFVTASGWFLLTRFQRAADDGTLLPTGAGG